MTGSPDRAAVLTWDWRQQPDLDQLAQVVRDLSDGRVHLTQAVTGSDGYALVVSTQSLDAAAAARLYRRWLEDGQDVRDLDTCPPEEAARG